MMSHYLALVSRWYGVCIPDILSPSRKARVVLARQSLQYLLRLDGKTLAEIGTITGRDHTCVIHSISTIDEAKGRPQERSYKPLFDYIKGPRLNPSGYKISHWAFPGIDLTYNGRKANTDKVRQ